MVDGRKIGIYPWRLPLPDNEARDSSTPLAVCFGCLAVGMPPFVMVTFAGIVCCDRVLDMSCRSGGGGLRKEQTTLAGHSRVRSIK